MAMFLFDIRAHLLKHLGLTENQTFTLVIDIFHTHFEDGIRELAYSMGIDLIFIPAGQTGELQPLDATVFGELKSKGAAMWVRQYTKDPLQKFNTQTSSVNLQE
jgi:putative sterol carrier protein